MSDIKVMCASVLKHSLVHLGVWRPVLWDRSWCCLTGALTLVFPLITYSTGVKKSLVLHELQNMLLNAYYLVLLFLWLLWSVQRDTMVTPAEFFALLLSMIGSTYNTKHPDLIFLVNTFEKKSVGAFWAWELDDFCTFQTHQMIANNPIPQLLPLCPSFGCCSHLQLFLFSKSFVSSTSTDMRCKLISIMHLHYVFINLCRTHLCLCFYFGQVHFQC